MNSEHTVTVPPPPPPRRYVSKKGDAGAALLTVAGGEAKNERPPPHSVVVGPSILGSTVAAAVQPPSAPAALAPSDNSAAFTTTSREATGGDGLSQPAPAQRRLIMAALEAPVALVPTTGAFGGTPGVPMLRRRADPTAAAATDPAGMPEPSPVRPSPAAPPPVQLRPDPLKTSASCRAGDEEEALRRVLQTEVDHLLVENMKLAHRIRTFYAPPEDCFTAYSAKEDLIRRIGQLDKALLVESNACAALERQCAEMNQDITRALRASLQR